MDIDTLESTQLTINSVVDNILVIFDNSRKKLKTCHHTPVVTVHGTGLEADGDRVPGAGLQSQLSAPGGGNKAAAAVGFVSGLL